MGFSSEQLRDREVRAFRVGGFDGRRGREDSRRRLQRREAVREAPEVRGRRGEDLVAVLLARFVRRPVEEVPEALRALLVRRRRAVQVADGRHDGFGELRGLDVQRLHPRGGFRIRRQRVLQVRVPVRRKHERARDGVELARPAVRAALHANAVPEVV